MTVTVRTNLATRGSAASTTNWGSSAGTGGVAALTNQSVDPFEGTTFNRVTWSTGTTAPTGGITYLEPSAITPGQQYAVQMWVRSNKAQTVKITAAFRDAANSWVNNVTGTVVTLVADTWTQLSVVGTAGALVTNLFVLAEATTGGLNWANGDKLEGDCVVIETGGVVGAPFSGETVDAASVIYAWTGTAGSSTSTATTYVPQLALVTKTDDPCDRVEITITDLTPTENTVTVWRTSDGKRQAVRGARRITMVTSEVIIDYEVPLGRIVSYELEVTAGLNNQAAVTPQDVTVNATSGWIQDPLDPGSAIRIHGGVGPNGEAALRGQALSRLEYAADMSIVPIMGSPDPVALIGQRQSASGVNLPMVTEAAQEAADLRRLIQQAPLVLVRPLPLWASGLPGLCYTAAAKPAELPVDEAWGGSIVHWELTGDLVAAPAMNILIPEWTYGDVDALWETYQQAQTALSGKSYLDVKKSPSGV